MNDKTHKDNLIEKPVLVLNNPNNDTTFRVEFSGKKGIIKYFDFDCGCGQTYPIDPMIGVQFPSGEIEEFWNEELKTI